MTKQTYAMGDRVVVDVDGSDHTGVILRAHTRDATRFVVLYDKPFKSGKGRNAFMVESAMESVDDIRPDDDWFRREVVGMNADEQF